MSSPFSLGLLGSPCPINLASDYFNLWPPVVDTAVYEGSAAAYYETDRKLHDALADSRAYRCGWLAWIDFCKLRSGKHG